MSFKIIKRKDVMKRRSPRRISRADLIGMGVPFESVNYSEMENIHQRLLRSYNQARKTIAAHRKCYA